MTPVWRACQPVWRAVTREDAFELILRHVNCILDFYQKFMRPGDKIILMPYHMPCHLWSNIRASRIVPVTLRFVDFVDLRRSTPGGMRASAASGADEACFDIWGISSPKGIHKVLNMF